MNLKKALSAATAVVLSCGVLASCGTPSKSNDEKVLNILMWDGYIPQDIIDNFQSETGIKMYFSNFESNEEMLQKLETSNGEYDLVIGSDYIIEEAVAKDLTAELDKSKIPNYNNLDPAYLSQYYDPDNKYTVPYGPGTPLIIYDESKIDLDINSYNDLWNPALAGKIVMMDDTRNVVGMTLKSMGKSLNETDPESISAAKDRLMELSANIYKLDYSTPYDSIISGEAPVAYMFTSQVVTALMEKPDLKVVYPEEGMGFGIDCWFVTKDAKHKDSAFAFLNYVTDAENGAKISEQILYQCPNKASSEYLSEDYKKNKALYIPSDVLGDTEFIKNVDADTLSLYDEAYTQFKNSLR